MSKTASLLLIHGAIEFAIVLALLAICGPAISALALKAVKIITVKGLFSSSIGAIMALKSIL